MSSATTIDKPRTKQGDSPVAEHLNGLLADGIVFYQKLRGYHWTVTGRHFFELHQKFEDMYNRWNETNDDIAERLMALGGRPITSLAEALEAATVTEDRTHRDAELMVRTIVGDQETLLEELELAIKIAESESDRSTVNLLDDVIDAVRKDRWMLEAWLSA